MILLSEVFLMQRDSWQVMPVIRHLGRSIGQVDIKRAWHHENFLMLASCGFIIWRIFAQQPQKSTLVIRDRRF